MSPIASFSGQKTPSDCSTVVRTIDAIAACRALGRTYMLEITNGVRDLHSLKDKLHLDVCHLCIQSIYLPTHFYRTLMVKQCQSYSGIQ